jgi:hypothetical protein
MQPVPTMLQGKIMLSCQLFYPFENDAKLKISIINLACDSNFSR